MGRHDDDKLAIAEVPGDGPIQRFLSAQARQHGLWLVGGTLPLRESGHTRVRNSCLVFAPDGSQAARYDKMHLFAFDNGREQYDEGACARSRARAGGAAGRRTSGRPERVL